MGLNPKAVASWGLLAEAGASSTRVISDMEIIVSASEPLEVEFKAPEISVELETAEISVELSDDE